MRDIQLDDYYDNDSFLELVEEYSDFSDYDLKRKIADEVYGYVHEVRGNPASMLTSLSEAKSLLNVMQYIINNRDNA